MFSRFPFANYKLLLPLATNRAEDAVACPSSHPSCSMPTLRRNTLSFRSCHEIHPHFPNGRSEKAGCKHVWDEVHFMRFLLIRILLFSSLLLLPLSRALVPPAVENFVEIFEHGKIPTEIKLGATKAKFRTVLGTSKCRVWVSVSVCSRSQ